MQYAARFLFGGLITMLAGWIADRYGPVIGGLFLAFPGIFPASISLVETHKLRKEQAEHKAGTRSASAEASVEAMGASAGAIGLMGFAAVLWHGLPTHALLPMLLTASAVWTALACIAWWLREHM